MKIFGTQKAPSSGIRSACTASTARSRAVGEGTASRYTDWPFSQKCSNRSARSPERSHGSEARNDWWAEAITPSPRAIPLCENADPSSRVIIPPSGSPAMGVTSSTSPGSIWSGRMTASVVVLSAIVTVSHALGGR